MKYAYDQRWEAEGARLRGMERLWDDGTIALLQRIGVGPGSRVAEVGAGAGSVVAWLRDAVGPDGHVLATDVHTAFVEHLAGDRVDVRRQDILEEPLPAEFDVVHARLLVEHVGLGALANLATGLRPGGVLLVEEYDTGCRGWHPEDPVAEQVGNALLDLMSRSGYDRHCGRKLPQAFETLGLVDVQAEGRARLFRSGTSDTDFYRLSIQSLRSRIVEAGGVDDDDIDGLLARMSAPGRISFSALMVACQGRRPAG